MRTWQINQDSRHREEFQAALHQVVGKAIESERLSVAEVLFILTRMLPELANDSVIMGEVRAACDLARKRGVKPIMP